MLVRPKKTAPASFNFFITVASYVATYFSNILDAALAVRPSIKILSLIASGMPSKGWLSPLARRRSAEAACSRASANTSKSALSDGFLFSISARHASTSCTDVISPAASFFDASVIESSFKLLTPLEIFLVLVDMVIFMQISNGAHLFVLFCAQHCSHFLL